MDQMIATAGKIFMNLHEQYAIIYDDVIVTTEPWA
jgi:hypothetical protein